MADRKQLLIAADDFGMCQCGQCRDCPRDDGGRGHVDHVHGAMPGVYHIIVHPAAAAESELEAICTAAHHARNWAAPYRVADVPFLTQPTTRAKIAKFCFDLVDAPTSRSRWIRITIPR